MKQKSTCRGALVAVALLAVCAGSDALAKFGISKTRVTLLRRKPPETRILAGTVAVEVRSGAAGQR